MKNKFLISKLGDKKIKIYYKTALIPISKIKIEKEKFLKACKTCPNYNKNWACPPDAPNFYEYIKSAKHILFFLFYLKRKQVKKFGGKTQKEKLNKAYLFLKFKIEKVMYFLETIFKKNCKKFLTTGSCRICYPKPCSREKGKKCKYPKKLRYSLEALGVNCISLSKNIFKKSLVWSKRKKAFPRYISVIAGLPIKTPKSIKTPPTQNKE